MQFVYVHLLELVVRLSQCVPTLSFLTNFFLVLGIILSPFTDSFAPVLQVIYLCSQFFIGRLPCVFLSRINMRCNSLFSAFLSRISTKCNSLFFQDLI